MYINKAAHTEGACWFVREGRVNGAITLVVVGVLGWHRHFRKSWAPRCYNITQPCLKTMEVSKACSPAGPHPLCTRQYEKSQCESVPTVRGGPRMSTYCYNLDLSASKVHGLKLWFSGWQYWEVIETQRTEPNKMSLSLQEHCTRRGLWDLSSFLSLLCFMVPDVTSFIPVDVKAMVPLGHGLEPMKYGRKSLPP